MSTEGIVRTWLLEQGWGVIDSNETPGGCWFHFSVLAPEVGIALRPGQPVQFEWEDANQDGFRYRALSFAPLSA